MTTILGLFILVSLHCIVLAGMVIAAVIETRTQRRERMAYLARIEAMRQRQTALMIV